MLSWLTILTNWSNVTLQWVSIYYSIYVSGNTYSFIDWMESEREIEWFWSVANKQAHIKYRYFVVVLLISLWLLS